MNYQSDSQFKAWIPRFYYSKTMVIQHHCNL